MDLGVKSPSPIILPMGSSPGKYLRAIDSLRMVTRGWLRSSASVNMRPRTSLALSAARYCGLTSRCSTSLCSPWNGLPGIRIQSVSQLHCKGRSLVMPADFTPGSAETFSKIW